MGTKLNPGEFDCYANALPNEPMFVLLARDQSAADLVDWWANVREKDIDVGLKPETDRRLVSDARDLADQMRVWRKANDGRWRS